MAYNNGFPMSYQQYYPQQQVGFQQPMNIPQQAQQQMMTPPTIHAEIVQVNNKSEAMNFPVGAGQAQMMMAKDDSAIFIKTAFANGQSNIVEYIRKAPDPETPPADYITREEFEKRLAELAKPEKKEENHE